ncbi:putative tRNA (cytidine(34)-2'-O)-methyltransferase [Nesterenkonia cremea]|uniref:Putative tRNA (cytidine(34)-2'-O)-methyltransferase n=1 Tax=Nesterenkonia cremea TaxID=1882340 RepID=A0A917APD3_9MICC|nr:tRNA (cytidine(34)-2'-O)-methyltransferase [Nesterenkonia cremea]GGE64802.1 putative tRNA (cytidine(34)-2'-O)-methyltransferase [Nesterenkonia cremea]
MSADESSPARLRVLVDQPEIPGNTGNLIRLAAVTGVELHLAEPLGFDFADAKLRRAGLDYHDLAVMTVHPSLEAAYEALGFDEEVPQEQRPRVFAFTGEGTTGHTQISYQPGDVMLFGRESVGLDELVKADPRITAKVRIPMMPSRRSLNLANSVSIAVYEAWRQNGFSGAA